jgi:hypothetical protein
MSDTPAGIANLEPLARAKEQKSWYWYYLRPPVGTHKR